ncbi:hypothetical protein B0H16DRAFT_1460923 [Mycena metata]|uniref:Uncharacterized protein n=1 Tax=Mycena metata TaxID=1033252 RepID=A0AAD7N7D2_9AGAR|nr:hypothetical protein B0H16DRAFT_1460923 [Mycena metata]
MDEKGIQLGLFGAQSLVLVGRDQLTAHHVEDGNRKPVTIIETTCADGTALRPVIYKGKTQDLRWSPRIADSKLEILIEVSRRRRLPREADENHILVNVGVRGRNELELNSRRKSPK